MAHKDRITIEQAVSLLIEHAVTKETVTLPLLEAAGFVCAEDVKAKIPLPLLNRSADLENASKETPVFLPVSDYLYAGSAPDTALAPGHAVRIMTGAPIPFGADCVIPQEITGCDKNIAVFYQPQAGRSNICFQGEDIAAGTLFISRGTRLQAAQIGLLASQGISQLCVFRKPKAAVMSTGDELVPMGAPLLPGKIYDCNQPMISTRLMELGAQPFPVAPAADQMDLLCNKISEALQN